MKNKRTGLIVPLLLGIIVLLLIAMSGIYLYKDKPADQLSVAVSTSKQPISSKYASGTSEAVPMGSIYKPGVFSSSTYLTSKTWFWVDTLRPAGQPVYESRDRSKFKLTFDNEKEGIFSASTDCNSIRGEYEIVGNKITFNKMMSTEMYCEGSQEAEYGKMLAQVVRFEIATDSSPSELLLTLKDGSRMLYRQ